MKVRSLEDLKNEFIGHSTFKNLLDELLKEAYTEGPFKVWDLAHLTIPESSHIIVTYDLDSSRRSIKKPLTRNISPIKEIMISDGPAALICKKENPQELAFVLYRDWESGNLSLYVG